MDSACYKSPRTKFLCAILLLFSGCSSAPQLMPTPSLYARSPDNPFADVPSALQSNRVEVLYLTDRTPANQTPENRVYGTGRSRSVEFGVSEVEFGKNVSWDQLVAASRTSKRTVDLPISVISTKQIVQFPPTPHSVVLRQQDSTEAAEQAADLQANAERMTAELSARLAKTPQKEVYIFVHGVSSSFDDGVENIAQLWHFLGRQGIPIAYCWPAGGGSGGPLREYTYDRESSEFTVYHLKQALRIIAACPDVQKINLIGHSRGCDVLLSALRELHIEIAAQGKSTRQVLKLGTVALAAPDLDMDVLIQRTSTARLGLVPERAAIYVCANDEALGISNWLFGGAMRLGRLNSKVVKSDELRAWHTGSSQVQIMDAQISDPGPYGHNYFRSNPAVSSDLVLLMRYHLPPGIENGRPLRIEEGSFWIIDDDYPGIATLPKDRLETPDAD